VAPNSRERGPEDLTLTPPFTPPLRGRTNRLGFDKDGPLSGHGSPVWGDQIQCYEPFEVNETRFLLRACAKTLRVLRLHPNDPLGEQFYLKHVQFQANDLVAESALLDFDLSWNKSLCKLEVPVVSVDSALRHGSLDTASRLLKYALSTIQSPVFSQVQLTYQRFGFRAGQTPRGPAVCPRDFVQPLHSSG
jgi:hypothetical protein